MSVTDPNGDGSGGIIPGWNELEASLQQAASQNDNTPADNNGANASPSDSTPSGNPSDPYAGIGVEPGSSIGSGNGPNDGYFNTPSGQPTGNRPLTAEDKALQDQYPSGGSFINPHGNQSMAYNTENPDPLSPMNPQANPLTGGPRTMQPPSIEQQAFAQPSLPMGSSTPSSASTPSPSSTSTNNFVQPLLSDKNPVGPQLPGQSSGDLTPDQRIVRDTAGNVVGVRSANGYFDQNFQGTVDGSGKNSMMTNFQQGDRGAGTLDALHILAEGNFGSVSDSARAVLGAEARTGSNFAGSPLQAGFDQRHNAQAQASAAQLDAQGNKAAAQNVLGQQVQANATPNSMADSFPMAQKMTDVLGQIKGVTVDPKNSIDQYGNVVFQDDAHKTANNPTGIAHIPMNEWADWLPVIEARLAAQNTPAADTTSNSGGGGRNYPARGGGSGKGGGGSTPASSTDANTVDYGNTNVMPVKGTVPYNDLYGGNYGNQNVMPGGGFTLGPNGLVPPPGSTSSGGGNPILADAAAATLGLPAAGANAAASYLSGFQGFDPGAALRAQMAGGGGGGGMQNVGSGNFSPKNGQFGAETSNLQPGLDAKQAQPALTAEQYLAQIADQEKKKRAGIEQYNP